jgi:hypothetical protein
VVLVSLGVGIFFRSLFHSNGSLEIVNPEVVVEGDVGELVGGTVSGVRLPDSSGEGSSGGVPPAGGSGGSTTGVVQSGGVSGSGGASGSGGVSSPSGSEGSGSGTGGSSEGGSEGSGSGSEEGSGGGGSEGSSDPLVYIFPGGGETLVVGTAYELLWSGLSVAALVDIDVVGVEIGERIVTATPNNGSFWWTVPAFLNQPSSKLSDGSEGVGPYKLRIYESGGSPPSGGGESFFENAFTIIE